MVVSARHIVFTLLAITHPGIVSLGQAQPARTSEAVTVAVAITGRGDTITLASRVGNCWHYRDLDASNLMNVTAPILSKDGTSLRVTHIGTGTRHPTQLFVDLTRKERTYRMLAGPRRNAPHGCNQLPTSYLPESRAVREAIEGNPCTDFVSASPPSTLRRIRHRRCIKSAFEGADNVKPTQPPDRLASWHYFSVTPNPSVYLPALQFAAQEQVFPGSLDTLSKLKHELMGDDNGAVSRDALLHSYLSKPIDKWKKDCLVYYEIMKYRGSWLFEFWFYYPFDVGDLGDHLHDSEHVFVEVDVLGGWVRRVIGAGHGNLAGNNIYDATLANAVPVDLPLMVAVELGKHATAPDIDRDFVFTPGVDENYYAERAKVWGIRDVLGNDNPTRGYERTMSVARNRNDVVAWRGALDS